jgi:AraC-like DNA-binding protein
VRSAATDFAPVRFSTSDLPQRDRLPYWREFFARKLVHAEVEPQSDLAALAPFLGEVEKAAMRGDNEALRLLTKYLGILRGDPALLTPELCPLALSHIHDLITLALAATPDGREIANGRGVRAARLRAIKADILANLCSLDLTVTAIALRQHVTPRYIHMLFETEGTTFSNFVLGQRLRRAHRMLTDPLFAHLNITEIAFAVGFANLSYFNRTFRRRFGATPSELRHAES